MIKATVMTDASHCPKQLVGGWAAWVRIDGVAAPITMSGILPAPVATSTIAEMMASANGIWLAAKHGATSILLQTDCKAVLNVIHFDTTRSEPLKAVWAELRAMPIMQGVVVNGRHVKGHGQVINARTWVNDWCDKHAGIAMREARLGKRRTSS